MKYLFLLLIFFYSLFFSSCSDVFEKDLQDYSVELNAPADGLLTNVQAHTFWWQELDELVDGYRLEIVSPGFDSVVNLVLRQEVTDATTFEYTLNPGIYEWSVVAFNSTSETKPIIYDLQITGDSSMDLSMQMINLVSPTDGFATTETEIDFLWQTLLNARDYKIQIASPDFSNSTFFIDEQTLQADSYTALLDEGDYMWRVRAENDQSVTPFSEASFSIDITAPNTPVLLSPGQGDTLSLPFTLSWDVDPESVMDTLYVFEDSMLSVPVLKLPTINTSFLFNEDVSDVYYWRVRSVDAAGNISPFSELRKFFIE